jgi:hypothetical protein
MADKAKKDEEVTPQGAVEVNEEELDQAAGGVLIGLLQPADSFSLNYSKIEYAGQKVTPQNLGSGGPHVAPGKKI